MVQPVSQRRSDPSPSDDSASPPPPGARLRDVTEIYDRPETSPLPLGSAVSVLAAQTPGRAGAAAIQSRLDAFRAAAAPWYHTPEGDVTVAAPFRMQGGWERHEPVVQANAAALRAVARSAGISNGDVDLVAAGRGTPDQVHTLTQALIDAGKLPPAAAGTSLATRIRTMMFDYGIGFDCAGYVRQAFSAAHPGARVAWRPPTNENLSGLSGRGLVPGGIEDAQPGDIIVLGPPSPGQVGHTVVVYDAHSITEGERSWLWSLATAPPREGQVPPDPRDVPFIAVAAKSPNVQVLIVDSSWGNTGKPEQGGVARRTWFHDETNGRWVSIDGNDGYSVSDRDPYGQSNQPGHPIEAVYRPASAD